jgi:hypothetical protein
MVMMGKFGEYGAFAVSDCDDILGDGSILGSVEVLLKLSLVLP